MKISSMFRVYTLSTILLILSGSLSLQAQLLSFPTAEGAGKFVSGGRGNATTAPKIYEVTTLIDNSSSANTPGTLRYACTNNSPAAPNRIIVFRVSGTIHLYATLNLTRANTTIAGQTAPGGGITIADYPVYIGANNIIVRYIRFRLGDKNQAASLGNDDAFGTNGSNRLKIMLDHCSLSWSNDEVLSIYSGDSLTVQWCFITEPLDSSYHDEGSGVENHAFGGIQGGIHATLHHNLYAHCKGRMPRFDGRRNAIADTTDFRNNIIYNWSDYTTNGGEGGTYNVVNNYYKYGPNTGSTTVNGVNRRSMLINPYKSTSAPVLPYGRYYLTGNYCFNSTTVTNRNWLGASFSGGSLADTTNSKVNTAFSCININMQTAQEAYLSVLQNAGTTLPYRDTLDERIVNDVINRTGKLINCQGGFPRGTAYATTQIAWPFLPTGFSPTDTDHDGMPDLWETQRGLNPASASDFNLYSSTTGYSNVETYLNGDTLTAPGVLNTCVTAKGMVSTNSGNWLHARDTVFGYYNSPSYLVSTDTNNLVASVYDTSLYGNLNVSYYTNSSIRLDANNKPYLSRNITIVPQNTTVPTGPVTMRLYITKKEYDDLKVADPSITSLSDLRIVATAEASCVTAINPAVSIITPTASGIFGSYRLGYYLEFQTSYFGTFFIRSANSLIVTTAITSLNCGSVTYNATALANTAYNGTATVSYNGGNGVAYTTGTSIASTGVTGLTATLQAGSLANGNGSLTYTITGTPATAGTAIFALSFGGQNCSISLTVNAQQPSITTLNCGSVTYNATALANTAYNGTATVPYNGGNGIAYTTGSSIASTGVTGLTATLQAGSLASGNGNLSYIITGTPSSAGTAVFALSFGGQSCSISLLVNPLSSNIPTISLLNCSGVGVSSTPIVNQNYSAIASIPYVGGNSVAYTSGNSINSQGVTGLTATLQSGILANGSGDLFFSISGTPISSGNASFAISFGGQSCSFVINVYDSTHSVASNNNHFNFLVKPNPIIGNLLSIKIISPSSDEIVNASIYDELGRSLINGIKLNQLTTSGIDISSLSNGIYFIRLTDKKFNSILTKKFIKSSGK